MGYGKPEGSEMSPLIYHCVSRVVGGQACLGDVERSHLRMFMRSQERFSGCRVLAYCMMPDHFHILLEIPHAPQVPLTDAELRARVEEMRGKEFADAVAAELAEAHASGVPGTVETIHQRYTYRMNDLSEFMKTFLQRGTRWFNRTHKRRGTLWEERYKSVQIEAGIASQTLAAYIDLNPVRAGLVQDPADYPWCSYGEAASGKKKKPKEMARQGLVAAWRGQAYANYDAEQWKEAVRRYRAFMGLSPSGKTPAGNDRGAPELRAFAPMLRLRIRQFSDGVAVGGKEFVEAAFQAQRARFTERRQTGARPLSGNAAPAKGILWCLRAFRVNIGG
jgi:putative transposase